MEKITMGCFGYLCVGCGSPLREGEYGVLKHIRHGKVLGETKGTYDSYGRVEEDSKFRAWKEELPKGDLNSHEEICKSEYDFDDSEGRDKEKMYKGESYNYALYLSTRRFEEIDKQIKNKIDKELIDFNDYDFALEWRSMPYVQLGPSLSGTEAWHAVCYDKATDLVKESHIVSKADPDQSWGAVRKKFSKETYYSK